MKASIITEAAAQAAKLAQPIKLLLLDVDGVLTDGSITYSVTGNSCSESKTFHIHDGLGIKLLQRGGVQVGIITGRVSLMVERRAQELGISLLLQGREDKYAAMKAIATDRALRYEEIAYMGDDLPDLAAICHAGLGIAPASAVTRVRERADFITHAAGGAGAVREACEFILAAQGKLLGQQQAYLEVSL